ncbi:dystroglycan-like [Diaphorina citri]|uniref:Dystroglycan 1 n=2 Tax=Diaphorina citri TaxID=121845 RepID=A0A3Q0INU3_DIACI|nr:dystroglycan-like [Diaphorina citri]
MSLLRSILCICLLSSLCLVSCYKPLQLNYGIPDTSTFVGKLFQYPIPDNAFSGTNIRYKIENHVGKFLPSWLIFDERHKLLEGVPTPADLRDVYVRVKARDEEGDEVRDAFAIQIENHVGKFLPSWLIFDERHKLLEGVPTPADLRDVYVRVKARDEEGDEVRDAFAIQVQPGSLLEPNSNDKRKCKVGENIAMLSLVIDKAMTDIPPKQRVLSMKNLAGYLGIETNQLTMLPQRYQDSNSDSILASGQGDVKRKRSDTSTVIMWQVGCEGEIWAEKMPQVERMKHIARDGTLSEVLQLPVMGWHIINNINPFRERRDIMNDGTRTSDEDGVGEEEDEEEDPDAIPITTTKKSILGHRHRHRIPIDAGDNSSLISGDAIVASRPSSISLYEKEATSPMKISKFKKLSISKILQENIQIQQSMNLQNSTRKPPNSRKYEIPANTFHDDEDGDTRHLRLSIKPTSPNYWIQFNKTRQEIYALYEDSKIKRNPQNSKKTKISFKMSPQSSNEKLEEETENARMRNIPEQIVPEIPYGNLSDLLGHTLPSLSTISSAENEIASSFQSSPTLPPDMGSTRVQYFSVLKFNESQFSNSIYLSSYVQYISVVKFNKSQLSSSIYLSSQLQYISVLTCNTSQFSSSNISVLTSSISIIITLIGNSFRRAYQHTVMEGNTEVTCSFVLSMFTNVNVTFSSPYLSGTLKFGSMVDWQIFVYNILLDLYGNSGNSSYITVRSVVTNKEPYVFTYTNESLPRNECPTAQINNLLEVISNTTTGQAKPVLTRALGRLMTVKNITWRGIGHCEDSPPPPVVKVKLENQVPLIRNPIDHLEAISGELLVYHVPEDTFFDHEDGGTRKLKLHLMTMDRTTIPPTHWLQFDAKNQEFYGIPQLTDLGRREYQLVCKDSNGLMANDGLEVIVKSPGPAYYSASFSLTLARPSSTFAQPAAQRAFLEKLAGLFGDRNASKIVNIEFEDNPQEPGKSTVVRWANRTLASNVECPETTIGLLREVLLTEDDLLQESLVTSLEKDYGVKHASVIPTGICEGLKTPLHTPGVERKPAYSGKNTPANASVEYLITFVAPLVVIVIMLLCAALIACLLYRRRHTGKMSVGNGVDSGILIRSKGIPVIFQDELEERLEVSSGTKSPIILKEEKPPLPPPEYNRDKNDFSRDKNDYSRSQPNATTALLSDIDDTSPYHPPPPIRPAPTYRLPPPYSPP